jgi:hypothetical protein
MRTAGGWHILALLCALGHELKRRAETDQLSENNKYSKGAISITLFQCARDHILKARKARFAASEY